IKKGRLSWADIEAKTRKVLLAKYNLGLAQQQPVVLDNLLNELNVETDAIRAEVAKKSLTLLKLANPATFRNEFFSWPLKQDRKVSYVAFGSGDSAVLGDRLQKDFGADVFYIRYSDQLSRGGAVAKAIQEGKYDDVIIGFHDLATRKGKNNFGITPSAMRSWYAFNNTNAITLVCGSPLAVSSMCQAKSLA